MSGQVGEHPHRDSREEKRGVCGKETRNGGVTFEMSMIKIANKNEKKKTACKNCLKCTSRYLMQCIR